MGGAAGPFEDFRKRYEGHRFKVDGRKEQQVTIYTTDEDITKYLMLLFQYVPNTERLKVLRSWCKEVRNRFKSGLRFVVVKQGAVPDDTLTSVKRYMAAQRICNDTAFVQSSDHRIKYGDKVTDDNLAWHLDTEGILSSCDKVAEPEDIHMWLEGIQVLDRVFPVQPSREEARIWARAVSSGLSQMEIAEEYGISKSELSRIMNRVWKYLGFDRHRVTQLRSRCRFVDPGLLVIGKRLDSRSARQRPESEDD